MTGLWKPYGIVDAIGTKLLFAPAPESVKVFARDRQQAGWRFYVVNQRRGRCYYGFKVITIPLWVVESTKPGKLIWYISHELAHTYAEGDSHGAKFMAKLREICPEQFQHWEIGYKPRAAIAAGIAFNKDFL